MTDSLGTALTGAGLFYKNAVLTDPAVAPVLRTQLFPDLSELTPGTALTHIGTGVYGGTLFSAALNNAYGFYLAELFTSDATMDNQVVQVQFEVRLNLGEGTVFSSVPVNSDGATTLVRGSSYYNADGLALEYTLSGYPALDVGTGNAEWRAKNTTDGLVVVTGDTISATQVRFDVSAAVTQVLRTGHYSLQGVIDGSAHTLKTANDLLTILDSI